MIQQQSGAHIEVNRDVTPNTDEKIFNISGARALLVELHYPP